MEKVKNYGGFLPLSLSEKMVLWQAEELMLTP